MYRMYTYVMDQIGTNCDDMCANTEGHWKSFRSNYY